MAKLKNSKDQVLYSWYKANKFRTQLGQVTGEHVGQVTGEYVGQDTGEHVGQVTGEHVG